LNNLEGPFHCAMVEAKDLRCLAISDGANWILLKSVSEPAVKGSRPIKCLRRIGSRRCILRRTGT
jgi:hypothetical protein